MARKQKVSDHVKQRLGRGRRGRLENTRSVRKYFLIVCEGAKTEPLYFEAFKNDLPKGVLESVSMEIEGEGKNTISLIEETIKIRYKRQKNRGREYDQVWAVFDRDSFPAQHFNSSIFKARSCNPEIRCAWSNEAFELWYLLHFEFFQDAANREQYRERLERAVQRRTGNTFSYRKNDPRMYQLLKEHGSLAKAVSWAKKLREKHAGENFADHNPCTLVYELVLELQKLADAEQ